MELVIDAGNSNIVFALFIENNCIWSDRIESKSEINAIYLQSYYTDLLLEHDIPAEEITGISISCVVTELTNILVQSVLVYFGKDPVVLGPEIFKNLPFNIPKPYEIGSDLVANAYAVYDRKINNAIIIDFGTALTFTLINRKTGIEGVTIAPGVETAIQALSLQTSKLPEVPIVFPSSVIGKNTTHAIQAGVLFGYVGLVKEIIRQICVEKEDSCYCIATGGLVRIMEPLHTLFDDIDPYLTLDGIRLIGKSVRGS